MTFASYLRASRGPADSSGRSASIFCDSHMSKVNQFLRRVNVVGILGVLNDTPLTLDVLRLVSKKLRSESISQLPNPTVDDGGILFDELFAILFLCSLSRCNMPVCWPRICKTLVLGDPNSGVTSVSVGNFLLGLFRNYMHMFECISQDRVLETLQLLQPRLHMLSSNHRSQSLGFDTGLLHAVSIAPSGWSLLHHAANSSSKDMVAGMIECGMSINVLDSDRRSPVHIAAISINLNVINYFIERYGGGVLKDVDKYGKTPLDLLLETLSLSRWQGKVDPHRLLSTMVRLIGASNSLWTVVPCTLYDTAGVSFNYNRDVDNNSNIYRNSNSNCKGSNNRVGHKDSGPCIWINRHASVNKKRILTNKLYMILSSIRHFDEEVVIPIVEIAGSCEISLWNIPVVMQSIFLAVLQRRYHLLKYLLKSFSDHLFQHLEYVAFHDSQEANRIEIFLEHCLTVAVQNNSSVRIVELLLDYISLQIRESTSKCLVNSASMHSFLHIAIVKSAFLSDKEENVELKSISKNITLTSSRAIGVNLSVMRRSYDDSSDKSGISRKQNGENVRDFVINLKAKQEDRLTLGEPGPLILMKILKGYPQGYLSSLLHTTQKVTPSFGTPRGEFNCNGNDNYQESYDANSDGDMKSKKKTMGNIVDDLPSIWSPFCHPNKILENLQFLTPICFGCLTGCPATLRILLESAAPSTSFTASVPVPAFTSVSSCNIPLYGSDYCTDISSSNDSARSLYSTLVTESASTSTSTRTNARTDSYFRSLFNTGCSGLQDNPIVCCALSTSSQSLVVMRQHLGELLFSELCQQSHGGLTPLSALLHLVKAQASYRVSSEYQGGNTSTSSSGLSFFSEYPALQKVKLAKSKVMKTLDILLEARKTFLRSRRSIEYKSDKHQSTQDPVILSPSENNGDKDRNENDGEMSNPTLWGIRLKNLTLQLESIERRLIYLITDANLSKVETNFSQQNKNNIGREDKQSLIANQGSRQGIDGVYSSCDISRFLSSLMIDLKGSALYRDARKIFHDSSNRWNHIYDLIASSRCRLKLASQMR